MQELKDVQYSLGFTIFSGIFGKLGEIQSVLCLAFGVGGVLYTGTLSGDIYKWQGVNLAENIAGAHAVSPEQDVECTFLKLLNSGIIGQ